MLARLGDGHERSDALDGSGTDAVDSFEVLHGRKGAVGLSIFDDALGQHWPYAREEIQFGCLSGVQIDQASERGDRGLLALGICWR